MCLHVDLSKQAYSVSRSVWLAGCPSVCACACVCVCVCVCVHECAGTSVCTCLYSGSQNGWVCRKTTEHVHRKTSEAATPSYLSLSPFHFQVTCFYYTSAGGEGCTAARGHTSHPGRATTPNQLARVRKALCVTFRCCLWLCCCSSQS